MGSCLTQKLQRKSSRFPPRCRRGGAPLRWVELDDLTEVAMEEVIMAAVDSYRMAGSERPIEYLNGSGSYGHEAANEAVHGGYVNDNQAENGPDDTNGSWCEDVSDNSSTPSPETAEFAAAAREEARHTAMRNSQDVVRAILETENFDDEEYRSRKLSALLAAALLAAAEKKAQKIE